MTKAPSHGIAMIFNGFEKTWVLFMGAMVLIVLCLYPDFIFGDHLYIFPFEGSDTYYQYWPLDRLFGEMLQNGEIYNWTYRIGLGKQVSPIIAYLNPFRLIVQLMPADIEAKAYVLKVILEIGCAALLMRLYLKKLGIDGISSLIFPLLYGFNGYLLLWGQHVSFGVIFSLIPLMLYSLEVFLQNHKMWPLVLSLSLSMSISIYFFGMAFVFLVIFMTFKSIIASKDIKTFRFNYLTIGFCYVVAGLLAARVIFPEILYYLESPRVGTPMKIDVFDTFGWMHYISLLRIFSNNIFGTGVHYYGPLNYYEAPQIYCGLLTLLLVPQFFCYAKSREKIIHGMVLGGLSLALFSPYVAHLFNATFTLNNRYTFVLIFFWIYMAAYALYYIDKSNSFNKPVFFISWSFLFLVIVGILAGGILLQFEFLNLPKGIARDGLSLAQMRSSNTTSVDFFNFFYNKFIPTIVINSMKILLLLSAYGIAFAIYSKKINKSYGLMFFLVIVELIVLNHPTINERITLREEYLKGNKGYYDGSREASEHLKSVDNTFYRIYKGYNSVFLNDAAFQGYYGTKGYTSLTEPSTASFYRKMGVPQYKNLKSPNYMGGFKDRPLLNSLVGVKYIFSKNPVKQPGLVFMAKVNDINIYLNKSALPMGFLYRTVINPKWFAKLKKEQKDRALFSGVLLDEPWIMAQAEVNKKTDILAQLPIINHISRDQPSRDQPSMDQSSMDEKVRQLQQTAVQIEQFEQENIKGWFETKNKGVLFFSIPYNKGWKACIDEQKATIMPVNNGFIGIPVKTGKHRIRLSFEPYGKKSGTYLSISTLFIVGILSLYKRYWIDAGYVKRERLQKLQ